MLFISRLTVLVKHSIFALLNLNLIIDFKAKLNIILTKH